MRRILFVVAHLYEAVVESSLIDLLRQFDRQKYEVDLAVMTQLPHDELESKLGDVPSDVRLINVHEANRGNGSSEIRGKWFPRTAVEFVVGKEYDLVVQSCQWQTPEFMTHCVLAKRKAIWLHYGFGSHMAFSPETLLSYDDAIDFYLFDDPAALEKTAQTYEQVAPKARLMIDYAQFGECTAGMLAAVDAMVAAPVHKGEHIGCKTASLDRETMIHVENLGICFRMDANKNTNLKEWVIRALKHQNKYNDFWALRNVNFDIKKGDIVGVIGRNGAGKSTLLKAISGIIEPAEGKIERRARVVPMLELGSGFDYELSGSENIFLNGAVLGYKEKFIKEHYQQIVDYAEIGDFINMPLKVYSSGMLARLAFSIATVVEPDILIVDEILSVGDESFQQKSYRRMMELMTNGTTVLYVSHSLEQIRKMCTSAIWLSDGKMVDYGDTETICEEYHRHMLESRA